MPLVSNEPVRWWEKMPNLRLYQDFDLAALQKENKEHEAKLAIVRQVRQREEQEPGAVVPAEAAAPAVAAAKAFPTPLPQATFVMFFNPHAPYFKSQQCAFGRSCMYARCTRHCMALHAEAGEVWLPDEVHKTVGLWMITLPPLQNIQRQV